MNGRETKNKTYDVNLLLFAAIRCELVCALAKAKENQKSQKAIRQNIRKRRSCSRHKHN